MDTFQSQMKLLLENIEHLNLWNYYFFNLII